MRADGLRQGFDWFRPAVESPPVAYSILSIGTQLLPKIYLFDIHPMLWHIPRS